jgi:hypothetical protein
MGSDPLFDTAHYASSPMQKLRRSFELGPRYYGLDLPRYFLARRRLGLPVWDSEALLNPLREGTRRSYVALEPPPSLPDALASFRGLGLRLSIPRVRLEALAAAWWASRHATGAAIECGAFEGATSLLLALLGKLEGVDRRVLVLDTFGGSPAPGELDGPHAAGEFAPDSSIRARLEERAAQLGLSDRLEIHAGLFAETFARLASRPLQLAFAHIDANLYQSTLEACGFVLPRLARGGCVVFDDYNGIRDLGARLAIDASLRGSERRPRPLAWCSAWISADSEAAESGTEPGGER